MADSKVASAATALEPMRKPGGSGGIRTKTFKVDIRATVEALINIASRDWDSSDWEWDWDWDASDYPTLEWDLSEVPSIMGALNKYSELLFVLICLANGQDIKKRQL